MVFWGAFASRREWCQLGLGLDLSSDRDRETWVVGRALSERYACEEAVNLVLVVLRDCIGVQTHQAARKGSCVGHSRSCPLLTRRVMLWVLNSPGHWVGTGSKDELVA